MQNVLPESYCKLVQSKERSVIYNDDDDADGRARVVVPNRGKISPRRKWGGISVFLGGNSGRAGNMNIAVNIALIIIHVSLFFLNNS